MTRKDFVLIAGVLKANKASMILILEMATALQTTNPGFKPETFVRACQS